jgi:redox-sensitive bicupin YhaK (pirin superfamily)
LEHWDLPSLGVEPHHPKVLATAKEARVIAINLPAGEQMQEHRTHERGYLVVISGKVDVSGVEGDVGFLAEFEPREDRVIAATEDSLLLLFLGPWPGEGHPSNRG